MAFDCNSSRLKRFSKLRWASDGLSLMKAKARGGDIRMVYSPSDALAIARDNLAREVVSRRLDTMAARGLIDVERGQIRILDRAKLAQLAETA